MENFFFCAVYVSENGLLFSTNFTDINGNHITALPQHLHPGITTVSLTITLHYFTACYFHWTRNCFQILLEN